MDRRDNEIQQAAMHRQCIRNRPEQGSQTGGRCRFASRAHARLHLISLRGPTGGFAIVYKCKDRSTGRIWAVKEINKGILRGHNLASLEVRARRSALQSTPILPACEHPTRRRIHRLDGILATASLAPSHPSLRQPVGSPPLPPLTNHPNPPPPPRRTTSLSLSPSPQHEVRASLRVGSHPHIVFLKEFVENHARRAPPAPAPPSSSATPALSLRNPPRSPSVLGPVPRTPPPPLAPSQREGAREGAGRTSAAAAGARSGRRSSTVPRP